MRKVPEIGAYFWTIKVLSTAMGEVTSDYLVRTINPVIAVALGGLFFAAALALQVSVRRYVPWVYWSAVVMVAVFGTMVADVLHVRFGIPYLATSTRGPSGRWSDRMRGTRRPHIASWTSRRSASRA